METRRLGKSDIEVSSIALGCWAIVGGVTWGDQDEALSLETVRTAVDLGVTFLDTAEAYGDGRSEELIAKALGPRVKDVVIASKFASSHAEPAQIRAACERSLRRLGRETLDLYQVHWASSDVAFDDQYAELERLRDEGKVRAIGVCNFGVHDLNNALSAGPIATNQVAYNLLWRAIEFGVQHACVEAGVGLLPYSPLMQGLLTGKWRSADELPGDRARTRIYSKEREGTRHGEDGCEAEAFEAVARMRELCERLGRPMNEVALAWLLEQPGVDSVLAGARSPDQVRANVGAADLFLEPDVVRELNAITDPVKQKLGPNPDMWQSDSRMR